MERLGTSTLDRFERAYETNVGRLVREAKLFEAKLGPIDGAGNVGKFLMQLAEGKPVAQPAPEPDPKKSEEKVPANSEKEGEKATQEAATS